MVTAAAAHVARLLEALNEEAAKGAARPVAIVSATFEWIKPDPGAGEAATHVSITRSTRTIVFSRGELRVGEALIVAASAVHRVLES